MASNIFIEQDDQFDGTAELLIEDLVTGKFTRFGRMSDISFKINTTKIKSTKVLRGFIDDANERIKARDAMLSFKLWEYGNDVAQLLLHEYGQSQTIDTATTLVPLNWRQRLSGTDAYPPIEDVAWGTDTTLAAITSVTPTETATSGGGASFGGGTAWTVASYSMWVVPVYVAPGVTQAVILSGATGYATFVTRRDLPTYYTFGALVAGGALSITNVASTAQAAVVAPALGKDDPAVTGWAVFVGLTSAGIGGAKFNTYVPNTITHAAGGTQNIAVQSNSNASAEVYAAAVRCNVWSESGFSTGTVSYTKRTSATDFNWDSTTGMLNRIATGALTDLEMVDVTVWVSESPNVTFTMGGGTRNTDYRRAKVYAVSADPNVPTGESMLGDGYVMLLDRVNFAGMAWEIGGDEENFLPGTPVECKCLSSGSNRFGTWTHRSRRDADYVQSFN